MTDSRVDKIGGFIIDMDGVLWHGHQTLLGVAPFFALLRSKQWPFVLATNNSSSTPQQYIEKLANMGIKIEQNEILTSSMATATFLSASLPKNKKRAFVIGEIGLTEALEQAGFILTDLYEVDQPDKGVIGQGADLVVSGLDRHLTWDKLATATLNIKAGALFFGTNADTTLPVEQGEVMGNGGTLAALEAATGVKPTCFGKPEPELYQQALKLLGVEKDKIIAIGDRLDTDILGAVNAGIRSMLVLTGISSYDDVQQVGYQPDWIFDDLPALTKVLEKAS